MDALISKAHTNPDHGTQGQVAHPLDQGQFLGFKMRFFDLSLIVDPIGEPDIETDRLHDEEIKSCQDFPIEVFIEG